MKRKEYSSGALALIHIRYILPVIFFMISLGTMNIECLDYATVEGYSSPISTSMLFSNAWAQTRYYLFSGDNTEVTQMTFSKIVIVLLPVLVLAFIIAAISTVVVAYFAIRHISMPERENDIPRMWFITFIPNRIVAIILEALTLPLLFLPRIMILLYDKIMNVDVTLPFSIFEPWVMGLLFICISIVLSVICANIEKNMCIDVFKKREKKITVTSEREEDYVPQMSEEERARRDEQAELIKKLLNKREDE